MRQHFVPGDFGFVCFLTRLNWRKLSQTDCGVFAPEIPGRATHSTARPRSIPVDMLIADRIPGAGGAPTPAAPRVFDTGTDASGGLGLESRSREAKAGEAAGPLEVYRCKACQRLPTPSSTPWSACSFFRLPCLPPLASPSRVLDPLSQTVPIYEGAVG